MKRPVWFLELIRDTTAPMGLVVSRLREGSDFSRWHPRWKALEIRIEADGPEAFEATYEARPCPGVVELGRFEVRSGESRLLLIHRARFKGWPVLILMGWWRLRSHRMWERLVESL